MSCPFVTRRRYEAELGDVKADRERIRSERDQFGDDRDATVAASARVARRYNALAAVVAVHIVTAEDHDEDIHPSVLRNALTKAGINLAVEFDQAGREGSTP